MTDLPVVPGADVIRALEGAGFVVARTRGSHHVLKHQDGRWTIVPIHGGRDLEKPLLRAILREAGLTPEQFVLLLRRR